MRLLLGLAIMLSVLTMPASAADEESSSLYKRFHISAGGFWARVDTEARLDSSTDVNGDRIDVESTLGLDGNAFSPRLTLFWRFTRRSGLSASYFDLKREGTETLNATIRWGDRVIPIGTEVESRFNTEVLTLSYTYAFVMRPTWELAISGGLHVTEFDVGIKPTQPPADGEDGKVTAPLPVVGLVGGYKFGKRWSLLGTTRFFALRLDDYEGRILELSAWAQYAFSKHVGIAAGLDFFRTDVKSDSDDLNGEFSWSYAGPGVYLTFF